MSWVGGELGPPVLGCLRSQLVSVVGVCEAADEAKVVVVGDEARVDGKRSRVLPRVHANWMGAKSVCGLGLNVCCILLSNPACGLG